MGEEEHPKQPLDLSIHGYLSRKRTRLGTQLETIAGRRSALLAGVHVFVNGRTVPSQRFLWQLITQHGGSFSAIMNPGVTHVVASGLAQTKIAQFRKSRVHVVTADWIVESIRKNSLLSVADFIVPDLLDSSQPILTDYFRCSSAESTVDLPENTLTDLIEEPMAESSSFPPAMDPRNAPHFAVDPGKAGSSIWRARTHKFGPEYDADSSLDQPDEHDGSVAEDPVQFQTEDTKSVATEEELMRRIGVHRFDKIPFPNPKLPSCTLTDPDFVRNFFSQSRLHFIGSWKEKFECCLVNELRTQKPLFSLLKGQRGHILHIDMDCFFASVSIRDRPDLHDRPVVVSHSKSGTGEVSTCNYVARSFGIRSGMWMAKATELCPDLVVVGFEFEKYSIASTAIYRRRLRKINSLAACCLGVGIGESILFARIATRFAKPNGLVYIEPHLNSEYLSKLNSIRDFPGVGPSTAEVLLNQLEIETVQQLRDTSLSKLQSVLGSVKAQALHDYCRGIDKRSILTDFKQRSQIGTELGWGVRFFVPEQVDHFLIMLCKEVAVRLELAKRFGLVVCLRIKRRHPDAPVYPSKFLGQGWCQSFSKSTTLLTPTRDADELLSHCKSLIRSLDIPPHEIRAVGLYVTRLQTHALAVNTINKYFSSTAACCEPKSAELKTTATGSDTTTFNQSSTGPCPTALHSVEIAKNVLPTDSPKSSSDVQAAGNVSAVLESVECPEVQLPHGWDPVVFLELPEDFRKQLLEENASFPQPTNPNIPDTNAPDEFDNIDLDVLLSLPRDIRMEIQFELKKKRGAQSKHSQSNKQNLSRTRTEVVPNKFKTDNISFGVQTGKHPNLEEIKSLLNQSDDSIISLLLSLMENHYFLQVEQAFRLWRKQCRSPSAFNLALDLVQERAFTVLNGKFKIDPL